MEMCIRDSWKVVDLVPKLVENSGWGGLVVLISLLFLTLSIVGMAHYSEDSRVNKTSHKLLFCASIAVSYTHLDVYKRQDDDHREDNDDKCIITDCAGASLYQLDGI